MQHGISTYNRTLLSTINFLCLHGGSTYLSEEGVIRSFVHILDAPKLRVIAAYGIKPIFSYNYSMSAP